MTTIRQFHQMHKEGLKQKPYKTVLAEREVCANWLKQKGWHDWEHRWIAMEGWAARQPEIDDLRLELAQFKSAVTKACNLAAQLQVEVERLQGELNSRDIAQECLQADAEEEELQPEPWEYLFYVAGLDYVTDWLPGHTEMEAHNALWNSLNNDEQNRVAYLECIDRRECRIKT